MAATIADIDRAAEALTGTMRAAGLLHPDAALVRGGAYGRTYIHVTGGPHYGTGCDDLTHGTRGEVLATLHAIARALELGRRSND